MAQVPVVVQCPNPIDTTSLHFKSLSKHQVFNADGVVFDTNTSLVAVSRNSGLTFVGTLNGYLILKSKYVFTAGSNIAQFCKEIILNCRTTHLATDFASDHLAVGCQTKMGPIVYIYNIPSFLTKGVTPIKTVPLSKPFQVNQLCELLWQPNTENGLTACFTDGSVSSLRLFQGSGNDIFSLPPTTQAKCLCWSPKGKQIVVGCGDGSLCQCKPELVFVKKLSPPPLFSGAVSVVNVLWISNFQFLVAYKDANKSDDFPVIVIVNAPKNEPIRFINYEDVTYSSTHFRPHQFYFYNLCIWNLIFVASANSIEVAVLHAKEDNSTWEQWLLGDASRAELPLNSNKSETFPLGISFDFNSSEAIPWGEEFLPPMPRLVMLSSEGLLITFNVINTSRDANRIPPANKEMFEDSWFAVAEKTGDAVRTVKTSQSAESSPSQGHVLEVSKLSQGFPSTFAPLTSQENVTSVAGTLNLKDVTPKQQLAVPEIQQQTPSQTLQPQVQIQSGLPSIFQNTNSPSKWSQFSFSLAGNSGTAGESGPIITTKPNEVPKLIDQNFIQSFANRPAGVQPIQVAETKDASSLVKQQKSPESNVEARKTVSNVAPVATQLFSSTPVAVDPKSIRKRTPEGSPIRSTPEIAAVDQSVYVTALWDEVDHFNMELKEVISRISALKVVVGTDAEEVHLRASIEKLKNLEKSFDETTTSQKTEIHAIKSDLIEAFAWFEDARSRNRQRKSSTFIKLKKSQELDPICSRLMTEIHGLQYYIENQLKQLYTYLMKEWMEHQDNCRLDVKMSMAIPSMEELYKTMHLELNILNKQRTIVEELRKRMKERNLKYRGDGSILANSVQNYSDSFDNTRVSELSKLADNLLQIKTDRDEEKSEICMTDPFHMIMKKQITAIAERMKKFTPDRQAALRDILTEREMLKTRSVKSTFTSSSFIRNTSSRIYSKALLTSKRKEADSDSRISSEVSQFPALESRTNGKFASPIADKFAIRTEFVPKEADLPAGVQHRRENQLVSSVSNDEKPTELFKFSLPKSTTVRPGSESEIGTSVSGEQKSTPFVFKAAPVSPAAAVSSASMGKSTTSTVSVMQGSYSVCSPAESVVSSSGGNSADVFAFKFSDVPAIASTAPTFSFSANKTSSAFSLRSDFSGSVFGGAQTTVSDGPSQSALPTVFSFSNVTNSSVPSNSESIFGNAANLFPLSGSLIKSSSGNSIFPSSSASSEALSVAAVTTTTHSESASFTSGSDTPPSKSDAISPSSTPPEVIGTVITSTDGIGRNNTKANTTVIFATTTTTNAPPTNTTATMGIVVTVAATPAVTSSSTATTVVTTSPVIGVVTDGTESETNVLEESRQETQEIGKSEEAKTVVSETGTSGATNSQADFSSKSEAEPTETPRLPPATEGFSATTPSSGIFSSPASTVSGAVQSSNSGSIFGQSVAAAVTTASFSFATKGALFPSSKVVTTGSSLFGTPASSTTTGSMFVQAAATTATTGNIFGQVTPTTTTSTFGQPPMDEVGQTAKLFGDVLGSNLSSRNIFETPSSTTTAGNSFVKSGGSIFGNTAAAATATTTVAAAAPSGSSPGGIFGSPSSNIFSKGLASQPQMQTSSTSSIFGQPLNTDSGNTLFGSQNMSSMTFGGGINSSPNQNPFTSGGGFSNKPVFGQSVFGQNTTGQNLFDRSQSSSIFGGSPPTTQNVFQSGGNTFGGLSPGPFSGGQSTTGQTVMGGGSAFQKPMGGNIFGSSPTFTRSGTTPTFGGAPTFGSPATFGSPPKVFGSPQGTFGQNQANAPTFGALANQTDGFANLALQSQTPAFGGNTFTQSSTFGGESNFGGTSFSSWRS